MEESKPQRLFGVHVARFWKPMGRAPDVDVLAGRGCAGVAISYALS